VINENRKVGPIEVREELIELLELSIGLNEETNGYFNIGLGEVTAVWKTLAHNYLVVPKEAYVAALDSLSTYTTPDLNKVIINKENNTVYLDDDKMLLDLGAIAKGYATQLAYDYLKEEKGIKRFKINAGSSSIAIGLPPKGKSIKTYIKDDNSIGEKYLYQDGMLGYIVGGNKHIATSGSAQQSVNVYDDEGYYTKIHHLVSPFTLEPVNTFYKVTLVGDDSILLDVYTTAVFLMTDEDAISFLEEHDIGYILYLFDYSIVTNLSEEDFVQYEIVGEIK
jgi:thiamine biosynthesis lipoprotein